MRCTAAGIRTAVVAMLVAVSGCGLFGGEDEKSITIALDQEEFNVQQGSRDSVIVTLTRSNFEGAVELSVEGTLPEGVTVTFAPRIIAAGSTTSRVRFIATGAAIPGTFTATLRATGEGVADKAVDITVSVLLTGAVTLGTSGPLTVAQGGGGDANIQLTRTNGNASNVALSVTGMPTGMTATFLVPQSTDRSATLAVSATAGVAPGPYSLTVTGVAAGLTPNPTTSLTVNVIAAPATIAVSLPFCSTSLPIWFAFQNEGFPWQRINATGASFNFSASQKVSIAYVQQFGNEFQTTIFFATRTELLGMTDRDCSGPKTLTGTTAGLTAGQSAVVVMGASSATTASANYTLQGVASRPLDLVATRGVLNTTDGSLTPDKLIVRRALDLASTIPVLDFTTGEAFSPVTSNLTVSGFTSGHIVEYQNNFWTTTSTYGTVGSGPVSGGATTFPSVPGAQIVAGDKHELFVDSYQTNGQVGSSVISYFTTTGDRIETLGPLLSQPAITVAATAPYARLRGQLASQPEYGTAVRFVYLQGTTGNRKFLVMVGTAGHYGSLPATWDILTPDLSGVVAFNNTWMPANGQQTPFSAEAFSGRDDVLFGAIPAAGETIRLAYRVALTSTLLRAPATTARARRAPLLTQYLSR